jgi:RNA polymerase-associated protein LEO1
LGIRARPFNEETFEVDEEEETAGNGQPDEEGSLERQLQLRIQNTIRWREQEGQSNGGKVSNARLINWSDGSMSLAVGSEIFDVSRQKHHNKDDHNQFVCVLHPSEGMLSMEHVLEESISFRPVSTASSTHKKLTVSVKAQHQKVNKTKFIGSLANPEKSKLEMEKVFQLLLRV